MTSAGAICAKNMEDNAHPHMVTASRLRTCPVRLTTFDFSWRQRESWDSVENDDSRSLFKNTELFHHPKGSMSTLIDWRA